MARRVPHVIMAGLEELEAMARGAEVPLVLIFDIDNTLVPQGAPSDVVRRAVADARTRIEALPAVERVVILTNGEARGAAGVIARGNKPWTSRSRLGLSDSSADVWVIGDQVLTDGFLAWRLGATFCQLVIAQTGEPARQAVMRWLGRIAAPVLFDSSGPLQV